MVLDISLQMHRTDVLETKINIMVFVKGNGSATAPPPQRDKKDCD